jgi:uncharacterized membrane protein YphA (DoxX/SURF4 family)
MGYLVLLAQVLITLGLFNVWLLRFNRPTAYRGGQARNMQEEFAAYGLPSWLMWLVGTAKVVIAGLMVIGMKFDFLKQPAALVLIALMVGAIAMHIKIGDPWRRALPATVMLALAVIVSLG